MGARLKSRNVQIVVICMLAGVVVYNVVHFAGKKPRKQNLVYEEAGLEIDMTQAVAANWATGEYKPAASWGRNPFTGGRMTRPAPAAPTATAQAVAVPRPGTTTQGARITGVMISGDRRYVLAGDLLLREGDRLGAGRIITINRDNVVVEYETGTKTIYIE